MVRGQIIVDHNRPHLHYQHQSSHFCLDCTHLHVHDKCALLLHCIRSIFCDTEQLCSASRSAENGLAFVQHHPRRAGQGVFDGVRRDFRLLYGRLGDGCVR